MTRGEGSNIAEILEELSRATQKFCFGLCRMSRVKKGQIKLVLSSLRVGFSYRKLSTGNFGQKKDQNGAFTGHILNTERYTFNFYNNKSWKSSFERNLI